VNYNHYVKSDYYNYLSSGIEAWTLLLPSSPYLSKGDTVSVYEVNNALEPTGRVSVGTVKWGVNNGLEVTNQQSIFYYITNVTNIVMYTVYRATMYQTGSSDPVATVLENTTGLSFVWSYRNVGEYGCNIGGIADLSKFFYLVGTSNSLGNQVIMTSSGSDDDIDILTGLNDGTPSDDILRYTAIEIRIYS
jgi:hypothetical protein